MTKGGFDCSDGPLAGTGLDRGAGIHRFGCIAASGPDSTPALSPLHFRSDFFPFAACRWLPIGLTGRNAVAASCVLSRPFSARAQCVIDRIGRRACEIAAPDANEGRTSCVGRRVRRPEGPSRWR